MLNLLDMGTGRRKRGVDFFDFELETSESGDGAGDSKGENGV